MSFLQGAGGWGLLCVAACSFAVCGTPDGGEWPQWGGRDGRNMVSDAKALPDSFVPGRKLPGGAGVDPKTTRCVKWAVRLGAHTYGNPTVAGGRVFVGTDDTALRGDPRIRRTRGGMVQCFDEATGKLIWKLVIPKRTDLPEGAHFTLQWLGVCSSPAVEADRVYVVTNACEVLCLDVRGQADGNDGAFKDEGAYMVAPGKPPVKLEATDADIIWRFDMIRQAGVCPHDAASCSPLIHGGFVYVTTSNGVDEPHKKVVAPLAPSLIVLDKMTGRLVATDGEKLGTRLFHCQWSSPSLGRVGGRTLIFLGGGDGVCYALEALSKASSSPVELKTVWRYDCVPPEYRYRNGKPIPYYNGDRRKKKGNKNDGLYIGPSQIIATPVFFQDRVYVAIGQDPAHGRGKGMLHCIDATGKGDITKTGRIWSYGGLDRSISTVAVADGLVYCPDIAGKLHCLDADTGRCYWVCSTGAETWSSPLVADGKIYLGTKQEFFVLAAGKELKVLSKIGLGAPIYATAIVAHRVLYVASQKYLWAVERTAGETRTVSLEERDSR